MSLLRVKELEAQLERRDNYINKLEARVFTFDSLRAIVLMAKSCPASSIPDDLDFVTPLDEMDKVVDAYIEQDIK